MSEEIIAYLASKGENFETKQTVGHLDADKNSQDSVRVSIVIPIYNQENCLAQCLDCLINQTYNKIEIICVNDCSTDNSLAIVEAYRRVDNRIVIINNEQNLTANIARKKGAIIAQGDYIMFIDPDDTLELDAIELLVNILKDNPVDILHFGTNVINCGVSQNQIDWYENFARPYYGELKGEDVFVSCFEKGLYRFNIWNKIYKGSICKQAMSLCVNEKLPKAQDLYAFFIISYFAKSYLGIQDKLYNYNFGLGISGGNTNFTQEKFSRHCSQADVAFFIVQFLIEQGTIEKYQALLRKTINNLMEDNLARMRECGKTKPQWSPEKIIYDWWIGGKLKSEQQRSLLGQYGVNVASIIADVCFKLYKNVSIKTRKLILENMLEINEMYPQLLMLLRDRFGISTKDRMFADTIIAKCKHIKYGKRYVPIVFATNNNYAPFCGVTINSLIKTENSAFFYDIYVMHSGLNPYYIKKMNNLCGAHYEVHCLNINDLLNTQSLYTSRHYSIEMYYRFFIPELFYFLPKVLYLDCDLIVLDSIEKLYQIDIGDNILGAARNLLHKDMYQYVKNVLKIDPAHYFNSGVLLINCNAFVANEVKAKCLSFLKNHQRLECPDQDALNSICTDVLFISPQWNFQWHHQINIENPIGDKYKLIDNDLVLFNLARNNVKIVHFTSNKKPWNYLYSEYAEQFWKIADSSVFSLETRFKYQNLEEKNRLEKKIAELELITTKGKLKKQKVRKKTKKPSIFFRFNRYLKEHGFKATIRRILFGKQQKKKGDCI